MARLDLNIVDRGTQGTEWIAADTALTAKDLNDVKEMQTDNSGALNSLPTPFARFFVAREAFRRLTEEKTDTESHAGMAYSQMVSDILDVYELLFYLKYHRNNSWKHGEKLEIREWDSLQNIEYLKTSMPILYNSVKDYYDSDICSAKLYFVVFTVDGKEQLLACSSPITGFITPPDLDKISERDGNGVMVQVPVGEKYRNFRMRRKSGGEYFRDYKPFNEREADFKNYMYHTLFGNANVASQLKEIQNYVLSFKNDPDIRNDHAQKLMAVQTEFGNALVVGGLHIQALDEIDVMQYFKEHIIRLPYRISRTNFNGMTFNNDHRERDYDYLMPFAPEITSLFADGAVKAMIAESRQSVAVSLTYNGKEYRKEYALEPLSSRHGKIVDLKGYNISFDLGIFPNILSENEAENNYFKIIVVGADEDPAGPHFNIDEISLSFYKNGERIGEVPLQGGAKFGAYPAVVRSRQKNDAEESGTKFYELYNTSFDLIEVKILDYDAGILIPSWRISSQTNEAYTYAIDLGTSNTFMSRCKNLADGTPDLSRRPELFVMQQPMVSYIHETQFNSQYPMSRCIEDGIFDKAKNRIKTEFVPPIIDGEVYVFPIRTAICGVVSGNSPRLFDNHNIAFFYEKMMSNDDQKIYTDIKWKTNDDMLRLFVRELLLIIKCDILGNGGNLSHTNIVWFSPLSFSGNERNLYQKIWTEEPKEILGIESRQVKQCSESEAPYYYYKKIDIIKDSDAVTVVDIGGGSTDFVYFKDNKPLAASSVHFGCDVLWENGFNEFGDARDNGIYVRYADLIHFRDIQELEDLYISMKNVDRASTKDIINFWLSNDRYCKITSLLRRDFQPVFIYHLTSILYYMALMYRSAGLMAPRTVVFSGNGSKYIDNFIGTDINVLQELINSIFDKVFDGEHHVHLELPDERKESTCYGGLYRDNNIPMVNNIVYHGDDKNSYKTVAEISAGLDTLKPELQQKYVALETLYKDVLSMLQQKQVIDSNISLGKYTGKPVADMMTSLTTYYRSQVKEKYGEDVIYNDSIFFIPIVERIFEMTKL